MLTLSRPHRQVCVTLAIVAATIAPTGYVALTAWRINRPAHRLEVEDELGRRLDLKVTLEGVRYPRPGMVIYTGAALWQPEPRRQAQLVEVARTDRLTLSREGRRLVLRAEGLALSADGPRQAMEQVGDLLSRAGDGDWDRVALSAADCRVDLGEGLGYELRDLAGSIRLEAGAPSVEASYRIVTDEGAANRCELVLLRDRSGPEPSTTLTLRTAEGLPLPAAVLDPFFASDDWLGPDARVHGAIVLKKAGAGDWGASFSGELVEVDLAAVTRLVKGHRLEGRARLAVDEAIWGPLPGGPGSGWVAAAGELDAGPGRISDGLLDALRSELRFRVDDRAELLDDGGDREFRDLAFRFAITPDGDLRLDGALGGDYRPDAVLVEPEGLTPIAFAPTGGSASMIGLRRTLAAPDDGDVPLVPASAELRFLDYLPLAGHADGADDPEPTLDADVLPAAL